LPAVTHLLAATLGPTCRLSEVSHLAVRHATGGDINPDCLSLGRFCARVPGGPVAGRRSRRARHCLLRTANRFRDRAPYQKPFPFPPVTTFTSSRWTSLVVFSAHLPKGCPPSRVRSEEHRRSTFQPRLPIDLRLSSAIHLPALPSNSTSDSHRLSDPSVSLPIRLQLALSTSLPAQPSSQPSTRVSDQPSSSAFASTCDLRRLPILRPTFRLLSSLRLRPILSQTLQPIFRLTSPINLPVPPSYRPATCAACRSSGLPSN